MRVLFNCLALKELLVGDIYLGIDDNELKKEVVRANLISELTEKYLKASTETW